MGQKVHPIGFRVGYIRNWDSVWYADKDYQKLLHEDLRIRRYLKKELYHAGISRVVVERAASKAKVYVYAAKPGMILGKRASGLDALRSDLQKMTNTEIFLNIIEVRKVETDAVLQGRSLRDALRLRPEVLRRLGWHYARVHAFELFRDPDAVADRIAKLAGLAAGPVTEDIPVVSGARLD